MVDENNKDIFAQSYDSEDGSHESQSSPLQECKAELESWREKYLRSISDFQNFKRRTEKEQITWMSSAQSQLIKNMLPIVDDMDRAMAESRKMSAQDLQNWIAGFEMIRNSLHKFLQQAGVQEITDTATFNPTYHEALASVEAPGKQSGDIVEVLQKGYTLKGEVLRPAQVTVAK